MPKRDEAATVLVSVVFFFNDTASNVIYTAIASVLSQYDERWELCICDDCSSSPATLELLDYYRWLDPRIKITRAPKNLHIAGATNLAASLATGRFVGFLDHDDVLAPGALAAVARALEAEPDCAAASMLLSALRLGLDPFRTPRLRSRRVRGQSAAAFGARGSGSAATPPR